MKTLTAGPSPEDEWLDFDNVVSLGDYRHRDAERRESDEDPEWAPERLTRESGIATAEFAIVTFGAVAFAGLLVAILSSGDVSDMLLGLVTKALAG
ncbi:DUF4244 domain-containing protein [Zhihengliuella flava]|uniref:DUF4244 domain-containing protein n=1 Tax=Zhihengliuella flava TaxID=1285193 RepID=A0A931D8W3_9MICC|nr:DUF4244 domain-containing protein [Zhihengliuella flava]MBG6084163.1 hypothetical protein [Zhihengliuella flava]